MAERVIARLQLPMDVDAFCTTADALGSAYPGLLCRGAEGDSTVAELFLADEENDEQETQGADAGEALDAVPPSDEPDQPRDG